MTANTALEAIKDKWKAVLDSVDFPVLNSSENRNVTKILLTQDVPDPSLMVGDDFVGVSPMKAPTSAVWALRANTKVHQTKLEAVDQMFEYYGVHDEDLPKG